MYIELPNLGQLCDINILRRRESANGKEQTVVGYKRFNEKEDNVYPSIGLCWTLAINEDKLKGYGSNFTSMDYAAFLAGFGSDKNMFSVEYDDVTPQFDDYILRYGYEKST